MDRSRNHAANGMGHARQNSMSTIESTVTRLLVATKQLLESLTQWAKGDATEQDVSDVYVVLGNEFNVACRAFLATGIDVSDLGDVPQALRVILERALSEDASQYNLDRYLPSIREIIVTLLRQLKEKQSLLRQRSNSPYQQPPSALNSSSSSSAAANSVSGVSQQYPLKQQPAPQSQYGQQQGQPRQIPGQYITGSGSDNGANQGYGPAKRSVSHNISGSPPTNVQYPARSESLNSNPRTRDRYSQSNSSSGSLQQHPMQSQSQNIGGGSDRNPPRADAHVDSSSSHDERSDDQQQDFARHRVPEPSAVPTSKKESALAALQKSDALERRASRRFSAYQFAKLTNGAAANPSISEIVPPLPNSDLDKSPVILPTKSNHSTSTAEYTSSITVVDEANNAAKSPIKKTLDPAVRRSTDSSALPRSPLKNQTIHEEAEDKTGSVTDVFVDAQENKGNSASKDTVPISLFLQLGSKTKKSVIPDASNLTLAALKLQFIEKFAYSSGSADLFPDIYILDHKTGIRYELEESTLKDIQDGTLLVLNVDEDDNLKKYLDDGLGKLTNHIQELNKKLDDNAITMKKLKEENQRALELASRSATEVATSRSNSGTVRTMRKVAPSFADSGAAHREVDSLRKDVAVIQQINKSSLEGVRSQLLAISNKAKQLQDLTNLSNGNSSRTYMEKCHKKLSNDSDMLLTTVDELQDIVEDMRKDVAQRGVRHSQRQLKGVSKELNSANDFLAKMEKYLLVEKPNWKKIWEKELETVCEEQQFFKLQEELIADLKDDLSKASDTFALVEAFSIEQSKGNMKRRPTPPMVNPSPVDGIVHAKDAVLSEVLALQPNHDKRLEAIERADKMRQKEKQIFGGDEFEDELQEFVFENKLKKSGGVEEAERRRKQREQKVLEEQQRSEQEIRALRKAEREAKRKEKEAMASAVSASSAKTDSSVSLSSSNDLAPVTTSSSPDVVDLTHESPSTLVNRDFQESGVTEKNGSSNDTL